MILIFVGGALGGIAGALGLTTNAKIFRSNMNGLAKFALTATVSLLVGAAYFVAVVVISGALGK